MVKQKKISARLLLVFALGILLGAVGMRGYVLFEMHRMMEGGPSGPGMRRMVMGRLDHELGLSPQQHDAVEAQLKNVQKVLRTLEATQHPQLEKEILKSIESLKSSLSPEQIQVLEALHAEIEQKRLKDLLVD